MRRRNQLDHDDDDCTEAEPTMTTMTTTNATTNASTHAHVRVQTQPHTQQQRDAQAAHDGDADANTPTLSRITSPRLDMSQRSAIVDTRITRIRPLIPPACLLEELPAHRALSGFVYAHRHQVAEIVRRADPRLYVVIGPCSIHDPDAALDYARRLKPLIEKYRDTLLISMRVYFEKPRTTVGWKGLINDPHLDGSFSINAGLRIARKLLLDINALGVSVACEMLDTISPQFISDLVTWGAIGARTTESQLHRELVSGLSMPIGFKNGTGGSKKIAVDAIVASRAPHSFLSVTIQGLAAIVETQGNSDCHIVLRGSESSPNYSSRDIDETERLLEAQQLPASIMIDCSHGNSSKKHENQVQVVTEVSDMVANGRSSIIGLMIESNIVAGRQDLSTGPGQKGKPKSELTYGQSVTDACIGWETTEQVLEMLHQAVVKSGRVVVA